MQLNFAIAPLDLTRPLEDESSNSLAQTPDSLAQRKQQDNNAFSFSLFGGVGCQRSAHGPAMGPLPPLNNSLPTGSIVVEKPRATAGQQAGTAKAPRAASANEDGYQWRKYGEKIVKGSVNPRSYYKCSNSSCPARKTVERAGGVIIATEYKGEHNHQAPMLKAKQRKALPPKHTRGVSKAADAIQGANADPANSNGSAHLGGSHASGGGSFMALTEASRASSAATTTEVGSDAWGGSSFPWPQLTGSNPPAQIPAAQPHALFGPHLGSHWGSHLSLALGASAVPPLSGLGHVPHIPGHLQLASAQLPAASLHLKHSRPMPSSSSLSGSEQHTTLTCGSAGAAQQQQQQQEHGQDQQQCGWLQALLDQLHQQQPAPQLAHSSAAPALHQALCSPAGLLGLHATGGSSCSPPLDPTLTAADGGPLVLGRSVLDAAPPVPAVSPATDSAAAGHSAPLNSSSSNSSSHAEQQLPHFGGQGGAPTPLNFSNLSLLSLLGNLGAGAGSISSGLKSSAFDAAPLAHEGSKPAALAPASANFHSSGHANGEVEQLAGHVGSSQLLQLQAVLATLSQQRQ